MASLWEYANPVKFMKLSGWLLPLSAALAVLCIGAGLGMGFFFTDPDYRQGETIKIIFIHVPAALVAINAWAMMLIASLIWLVRRHHVSALVAKAGAPIGATMTLIGLITGAVWGQPMWGTWWAWDPRLTSFLILFLFYVGYIALWSAIDDADTAADLTSVLCIVGSVFAVLSRYAALFWNQGLHQGASLSVQAGTRVDWAYKGPLYLSMLGFTFLFLALVLAGTRTEIRARRVKALLLRERAAA
ncbi:MAG: heme ABC transporter permease CcmC [Paracoccaceae bacterium]